MTATPAFVPSDASFAKIRLRSKRCMLRRSIRHRSMDSTVPLASANPLASSAAATHSLPRQVRASTARSPGSSPHALHVRSPLIHSDDLSRASGRRILLKLENVQPSGSFKIRGIGYLCAKAKERGCTLFVSSSGGNAGAAVAYAGGLLGVPTIVCVPSSTPNFMRERLRRLGAEVQVHGDMWSEADLHARELSKEPSSVYISPFDHPDIWEGHSTIIDELVEDLGDERPSAIVVSVGGGGLTLGLCVGLERVGWTDVQLLAAETKGADSFAAMYANGGELVTLPGITSIAKSLGAVCVSSALPPWLKKLPVSPVVVSDRQAVEACGRFSVDHRSLVEPACGATLAVGYSSELLRSVSGRGPVVLVVCGGNIATPAMLQVWKELTGAEWSDLV